MKNRIKNIVSNLVLGSKYNKAKKGSYAHKAGKRLYNDTSWKKEVYKEVTL